MNRALKPLTATELKEGYIYVYWDQVRFDVHKIGYSTCKVQARLRRWESKCKQLAPKQYVSPCMVRNVKRLERLVHAELRDFRVCEPECRGCKGMHMEWFMGVGLDRIIETIGFWTDWITKGQYEKVGKEWKLKEDSKIELASLCTRFREAKAS